MSFDNTPKAGWGNDLPEGYVLEIDELIFGENAPSDSDGDSKSSESNSESSDSDSDPGRSLDCSFLTVREAKPIPIPQSKPRPRPIPETETEPPPRRVYSQLPVEILRPPQNIKVVYGLARPEKIIHCPECKSEGVLNPVQREIVGPWKYRVSCIYWTECWFSKVFHGIPVINTDAIVSCGLPAELAEHFDIYWRDIDMIIRLCLSEYLRGRFIERPAADLVTVSGKFHLIQILNWFEELGNLLKHFGYTMLQQPEKENSVKLRRLIASGLYGLEGFKLPDHLAAVQESVSSNENSPEKEENNCINNKVTFDVEERPKNTAKRDKLKSKGLEIITDEWKSKNPNLYTSDRLNTKEDSNVTSPGESHKKESSYATPNESQTEGYLRKMLKPTEGDGINLTEHAEQKSEEDPETDSNNNTSELDCLRTNGNPKNNEAHHNSSSKDEDLKKFTNQPTNNYVGKTEEFYDPKKLKILIYKVKVLSANLISDIAPKYISNVTTAFSKIEGYVFPDSCIENLVSGEVVLREAFKFVCPMEETSKMEVLVKVCENIKNLKELLC